jgi:hypothetical protein
MKKFLIVAALVAASAVPVMPASAADMGTTAKPEGHAICYLLPLLPKCVAYWKEKGEEVKAKWDAKM